MITPKDRTLRQRFLFDLLSYRWLLLLIVVGTILEVGLTAYLPILIGQAVDASLSPERLTIMPPILVKMMLIIALNALAQWITPF